MYLLLYYFIIYAVFYKDTPFILRHRRILEAFRVEWCNSTPRFASLPERENKNIKYFTLPTSNENIIFNILFSPNRNRPSTYRDYIYTSFYITIGSKYIQTPIHHIQLLKHIQSFGK